MGKKIAVDLDGTLAYQDDSIFGSMEIGEPIIPMVNRIKEHLKAGDEVVLFTARASTMNTAEEILINNWCKKHLGQVLPITCVKTHWISIIYDNIAVQVITNTGEIVMP